MADTELPIPIEIPWRLAATTQSLQTGFPDDTTLSLFVYEPQSPTLAADYPAERLVYLKFTASISPCAVDSSALPEWARGLLVGGAPVLQVVLDVAVTPEPFATGGIRPYFHAAAPVRRSMVESGVIGQEVFEGESDGVSMGRSASQLYESVSSQVSSRKTPLSAGIPRTQESTVDSSRSVQQFSETVNREASTERRELLSHMTRVDNVLTLLNAKHVGSPFLRFTLSPRPLTPLATDPEDPNLWYRCLIERRSSGIEGIQEFLAVVVVPRGTDFCVQALLRRICVVDDPPVPPQIPRRTADDTEMPQLIDYLYRKYPMGTPLDLLDVDVLGKFDRSDAIPAVYVWWLTEFTGSSTVAMCLGQFGLMDDADQPFAFWERFIYKTGDEVRRDMLMDQYQEDLARSPLERGSVQMRSLSLQTCFRFPATGWQVSQAVATAPAPADLAFAPDIDVRAVRNPEGSASASDGPSAFARWNLLERQLFDHVARQPRNSGTALSFRAPKLVAQLLRRLARLDDDDPRNLTLERAAAAFRFTAAQTALLKSARIADLGALARAILSAPAAAQQYQRMTDLIAGLTTRQRCQLQHDPAKPALSARDARALVDAISATLPAGSSAPPTPPARERGKRS